MLSRLCFNKTATQVLDWLVCIAAVRQLGCVQAVDEGS